jgi:hypothetical protein
VRLLAVFAVALLGACADPKAPEYPCVVEGRAAYQTTIPHDYFAANDAYRQCLRRRGLLR